MNYFSQVALPFVKTRFYLPEGVNLLQNMFIIDRLAVHTEAMYLLSLLNWYLKFALCKYMYVIL